MVFPFEGEACHKIGIDVTQEPRRVFESNISSVHRLVDDKRVPIKGNNIKVAVIDSGINANSIQGKIVDRYNFINDTEDVSDDNGHGTIVTDIIWNVAPNAEILEYKVLDKDLKGTEAHIIAALERAIYKKADIINLSFGDPKYITYESDNPLTIRVEQIIKQGIPVIVAAGNQSKRWGVFSPGSSPLSVTVGATTEACTQVAPYSNQGPILGTWEIKPDFLAPGTYYYNHTIQCGTSFAAPYISAITALIKQKNPSWTPKQIKSALATTATVLRENRKKISPVAQGSGLVNAYKAINTTTIFSPTHISFDPIEIEQREVKRIKTFTIENISDTEKIYSLQWTWDDAEGFINEMDDTVIVPPFEKKKISLSLSTTPLSRRGTFSGSLLIRSNEEKWHIPLLAFISEEGEIPHPSL